MAATDGRRKKPPAFSHLPKTRAKKLKKTWIENKKIKRRWKVQKEREGLVGQHELPGKGASELEEGEITSNAFRCSDAAHGSRDIETTSKPSHDDRLPAGSHSNEKSIRQVKRQAYSSNSPHNRKLDASQKTRSGRGGPGKGQPDMKLRMNDILEKIKRDFS
ncbi:hypothetical protein F5I97DRAFT_1948012 [Phlebopus sp. FC_14]|nr:hypothetical protein F5I97DRAFT_1948012 [Phlebopus sp. FC_14]